jgi:cytochrome P450
MNDRERALDAARNFDGSTGEFLDHEFETYDRLREHLPIAKVDRPPLMIAASEASTHLLTRYDHVSEVLRNTSDFSSQIAAYPVRP